MTGLGWELREGPSEEALMRRKKEPAMGTWEVGKGAPGRGYSKGNGPELGMSLECSREDRRPVCRCWRTGKPSRKPGARRRLGRSESSTRASHLNLEQIPLDDERGSWEMSWEATAVVQAWIKRAVELIQEHSGGY